MTPEELMAEVLAEAQRFDALQDMGNYSASPFSPESVALKFADLGEAAVPYLIAMIKEERKETRWALLGLDALGPVAKAASDALAERVATDLWTARTLFRVDPERALAMGLHRHRDTYQKMLGHYYPHGYEMYARIATELLEDPDPEIVRLVFLPGYHSDPSLYDLARKRPDLVPVQLLRAHTRHPERHIRDAAVRVLAVMRDPADAFLVLDAIESLAGHVEWLGPLPGSERHASDLALPDLYELLRRRRCAGLSNAAVDYRSGLHRTTVIVPRTDYGYQARIARETMDVKVMHELPKYLEFHFAWDDADPILTTLYRFGAAGREALEVVLRTATGRLLRSLTNLEAKLIAFTTPPWLARADADFAAGKIAPSRAEHGKHIDSGAYACYAFALLEDPGNRHAAFQLAWIDRGSGTPITSERIAWLRSLGMRDDELLGELAHPAPREASSAVSRASHLDRVRRALAG